MKIERDYRFSLPRKIVWKYLKDDKVLRNSLPGCKSFSETSRGEYLAELEINIGPIRELFTMEIRLEEEKPPSSFRMRVKGKGVAGEISGRIDMIIKEHQVGSLLCCKVDAEVTGALALAGQRLLEIAAAKGMETFFQKVEKEIKQRLYQLKNKGR